MPVTEAILTVIREWIAKGQNDLTAAAQILRLGAAAPTDTVSFHAQQCVEKHLKALLVSQSLPFQKTHNIRILMSLIPKKLRPDLPEDWRDRLTRYAVMARYPDAGLDISGRTLSAAGWRDRPSKMPRHRRVRQECCDVALTPRRSPEAG